MTRFAPDFLCQPPPARPSPRTAPIRHGIFFCRSIRFAAVPLVLLGAGVGAAQAASDMVMSQVDGGSATPARRIPTIPWSCPIAARRRPTSRDGRSSTPARRARATSGPARRNSPNRPRSRCSPVNTCSSRRRRAPRPWRHCRRPTSSTRRRSRCRGRPARWPWSAVAPPSSRRSTSCSRRKR